jgi:phosphoribosylanthranilate isomerase
MTGLPVLIKVSGINNLTHARYCAGMGTDILGFCPEQGRPDFVDLPAYREITRWVKGVRLAGEFVQASAEEIVSLDSEYGFDLLQIPDPACIPIVSATGKQIILSHCFDDARRNPVYAGIPDDLLEKIAFHLVTGDFTEAYIFNEICRWSAECPIILGSGINPNNIRRLIDEGRLAGFNFKSGTEIKPGFIDSGELDDIFDVLHSISGEDPS